MILTNTQICDAFELYRKLSSEYAFDSDVMTEDSDKERLIKWVINNRISAPDRIIIQLFAELGSLRKLGAQLGISKSTAEKEVTRIRLLIYEAYNEIQYERICKTRTDSRNADVAH